MAIRRRLADLLVSVAGALNPVSQAVDRVETAPVPQSPVPARAAPLPTASDEARDTGIRQLLEVCAFAFVPGGQHVRANIMTFTADRLRRVVNRDTAFNMEGDPDADLEID